MGSKTTAPARPLAVVAPTRVWEQQPGESAAAYAAFKSYLAVKEEGTQGASGIREVARRVSKSVTTIRKFSVRWKWVERQRAWENNTLLLQEREMQAAMRQHSKVWAERRIAIREAGFELGLAMLDRAKQVLALPVADREVKETVKVGRTTVDTVVHMIFKENPKDARLLADTGLKLARLSADMSTENLGIPSDVDFDNMTDEEVDAYIERLTELRQQQIGGGAE